MDDKQIIETRIKKVSTLSQVAQKEVRDKLAFKSESFNFKGYAKINYTKNSFLSVCSIDPIEGTIINMFDQVMTDINK